MKNRPLLLREKSSLIVPTPFKAGATALGLGMLALVQLHAAGPEFGNRLHLDDSPPLREGALAGYSAIVDQVAPSVVSIVASKAAEQAPQDLFRDLPFQFRAPGNARPAPRSQPRQQGLGSGVILTSDGYIVTNNHVVEGAEDIQVVMNDGKAKYPATVVGLDPQSDLAVLKVNATNLPPITLGDSSQVRPGDFVLAIGNPFGLARTVTSGIVSAVGRNNLNIAGYENFIQTDASINPGNSGGALVDNRGHLVGINTAIFSKSGGNVGIGFAIPSKMVGMISEQLVTNGSVERGYLGVMLGELTPDLASAFGIDTEDGILVNDVMANTPAAQAGFEAGDVIVQLDGVPVKGMAELRLDVSRLAPDSTAEFTVMRDGKERVLKATIGRLTPETVASARTAPGGGFLDGVELAELTPSIAQQLGYSSSAKGVVVSGVAPDSLAFEAGLREGDVITQVNRSNVTNIRDAIQAKASLKEGNVVLLKVVSEQGPRFLAVKTS